MARVRAHKRLQTPSTTYRLLVLNVISDTRESLSGQEIADRTGLTYRQTIDALNALNNMEKVLRVGRKFTARWSAVPKPVVNPALLLEQAIKGFFR